MIICHLNLYSGPPYAVPECVLLICTGLFVGGVAALVQGSGENWADIYFTPTIFFVIILPPIVFEAGYFMPKDAFFDNIGTILTYALVGTFFNAMAIGGSIYAVVSYGLVWVSWNFLFNLSIDQGFMRGPHFQH